MQHSQSQLLCHAYVICCKITCPNGQFKQTSYFELVKSVLKENNLMNSPEQISNVDVSGMPLNDCAPKVVTTKGQKKSGSELQGTKVRSPL